MIKVRKSVFETNSSSTHSLCITKNALYDDMRKELNFEMQDFGWENEEYHDAQHKANYIYTALSNNGEDDLILIIADTMRKNGIKATFEDPDDKRYGGDKAYIDHAGELFGVFRDIVLDEEKLLRFLFSTESFIKTGNDNDDLDVSINVSYPHDEIYKGN